MNYTHFSIEERICLREYYKKGLSYRKIAEMLGENVSSISRELRRNCTFMNAAPAYYPHTAQKKSNLRRSYNRKKDIYSVSKFLRHSNVEITAKIYIHKQTDTIRDHLEIY